MRHNSNISSDNMHTSPKYYCLIHNNQTYSHVEILAKIKLGWYTKCTSKPATERAWSVFYDFCYYRTTEFRLNIETRLFGGCVQSVFSRTGFWVTGKCVIQMIQFLLILTDFHSNNLSGRKVWIF